MKVKLIHLGEPSLNRFIYNEDNFKNLEHTEILGGFASDSNDSGVDDLANASHLVKNITVKDNSVVGEVIILKTENGKKLEKMLSNIDFRIAGIGAVDSNNAVSSYELVSVNAVEK
jgi:hypothetical protein